MSNFMRSLSKSTGRKSAKLRVSIRLPDELHQRAKCKADAEGRTLTSVIEEGLREVVFGKQERRTVVTPR